LYPQADVIAGLRQYSRALSAARSQNAPKRTIVAKPRKPRSVTELSNMQFTESLGTIGRKRRLEAARPASPLPLPKLDLFVRPQRYTTHASPIKEGVGTPSATPGAAAAAHALASMWQSVSEVTGVGASPPSVPADKGVSWVPGQPPAQAGPVPASPEARKVDPAAAAAAAAVHTTPRPGASVAAELLAGSGVTQGSVGPAPDLIVPGSQESAPVQRTLSFLSRMQQTLTSG
jgi:hypothetical protein